MKNNEIYQIEDKSCLLVYSKNILLFSWDLIKEANNLEILKIITPFNGFTDDYQHDDIGSIIETMPDTIQSVSISIDDGLHQTMSKGFFMSNHYRLDLYKRVKQTIDKLQRKVELVYDGQYIRYTEKWDVDVELKEKFDNYLYRSLEVVDNEVIIQDSIASEIKPILPNDYDPNHINTITIYLSYDYYYNYYLDSIIPLVKKIKSLLPHINQVKVMLYSERSSVLEYLGYQKQYFNIRLILEKIEECFKATQLTNNQNLIQILEKQKPYYGYNLKAGQEKNTMFVYCVNDENIDNEIVLKTHIKWRSSKIPKVGQIPNGVKKITFDLINEPIGQGIIPESVIHWPFQI
ncbi:hypothetical protein CYY_004223 [Polysphondylium violaceum]|uniref:Uncharacterized protein n=1 Tax=Polysphondylium violaceum TaxID=133409 RepID=A0A8J4PTN3_9MYCE|nr:hypothetical protein CYY_004223 [Polysphondylium violaceum]